MTAHGRGVLSRRAPRPGAAALVTAAVALAISAIVGACAVRSGPTFPPAGSTVPPVGDATAVVRSQIAAVLAVEGLQLVDAVGTYRSAEGARFAAAPRSVVQVTLPNDLTHGYIVLYAFASPADALDAAKDQASYIATGPGRVQFAPDTRFTIRVSGSNAVFFAWSPESSPDPRTSSIPLALSQVGTGVDVPS